MYVLRPVHSSLSPSHLLSSLTSQNPASQSAGRHLAKHTHSASPSTLDAKFNHSQSHSSPSELPQTAASLSTINMLLVSTLALPLLFTSVLGQYDSISSNTIQRRGCTRASQCSSKLIANQMHTCKNHSCHKACKPGFQASGGKCQRKSSPTQAPQAKKKSSSVQVQAQAANNNASPQEMLASQGITGFLGQNGAGIGSWFRTDSSQDSTNDSNDVPGFAPDVSVMLENFGGDYNAAGTAYCGLEAEVTTPDGRTALLVIADGFDPKWVRTPGSIDIIVGVFGQLFGRTTTDKNDVIQGITWKLTGNRNPQFAFKGPGSG
ncbi:hypothetical protein P7C70_g1562, partial [Phenoliferia sp. Uapishka_3]